MFNERITRINKLDTYTLYTSLVRITKEYNIMILVGLIKSIIKNKRY